MPRTQQLADHRHGRPTPIAALTIRKASITPVARVARSVRTLRQLDMLPKTPNSESWRRANMKPQCHTEIKRETGSAERVPRMVE